MKHHKPRVYAAIALQITRGLFVMKYFLGDMEVRGIRELTDKNISHFKLYVSSSVPFIHIDRIRDIYGFSRL